VAYQSIFRICIQCKLFRYMLVDIMVSAEFFIIEMMPCLKYINMRDHAEIMAADHHRLQNIVKRSMDVQIRCLEPFGPIIKECLRIMVAADHQDRKSVV